MRPDTFMPGSPEDWIHHAKSDLTLAKIARHEDVLLENLCFHAQQAVEKALKAVSIYYKIDFPKTHNIKIILDILQTKIVISEEIIRSSILTDYAVTSRYPGEYEEITYEEYCKAIELAEKVFTWANKIIHAL